MTSEQADAVILEMQRLGPNPSQSTVKNYKTDYCVGGIVCAYAHSNKLTRFLHRKGWRKLYMGFPLSYTIAVALETLNPKINAKDKDNAFSMALRITYSNYVKEIKMAWVYVKLALVDGE